MVATARGSLRVMELLLDHGAQMNIKDAFGQTADSFAILFNQKQSRRTLIQFQWKKRNEKSMVREREIKSAQSRQKSASEQAAEESDRKRDDRVAKLAEQRRKRQEQLAAQQLRFPKAKSEISTDRFAVGKSARMILASPTKPVKQPLAVRFVENEQENESDTLDKSLERISMTDASPAATVPNTASTTAGQPTQKLFAHQFYDVYAGMTEEEWNKVRNAFMAQLFDDQ